MPIATDAPQQIASIFDQLIFDEEYPGSTSMPLTFDGTVCIMNALGTYDDAWPEYSFDYPNPIARHPGRDGRSGHIRDR